MKIGPIEIFPDEAWRANQTSAREEERKYTTAPRLLYSNQQLLPSLPPFPGKVRTSSPKRTALITGCVCRRGRIRCVISLQVGETDTIRSVFSAARR